MRQCAEQQDAATVAARHGQLSRGDAARCDQRVEGGGAKAHRDNRQRASHEDIEPRGNQQDDQSAGTGPDRDSRHQSRRIAPAGQRADLGQAGTMGMAAAMVIVSMLMVSMVMVTMFIMSMIIISMDTIRGGGVRAR